MPKNITPAIKTTRRKTTPKTETPIPVTVEKTAPSLPPVVPNSQAVLPPLADLSSPAKKQSHHRPRRLWLRWVAFVFIIIGMAVIVYPFWPDIQYKFWPPSEDTALASLTITNQANTNSFVSGSLPINRKTVTGDNRIIIQKIGVDMKIVEGTNEKTALNLGAWHLPYTSSPDKGGNSVITAHRYKYRPPSKETFYLLDKLIVGDTFTVHWRDWNTTTRLPKRKWSIRLTSMS
jgi:hypothetical protein